MTDNELDSLVMLLVVLNSVTLILLIANQNDVPKKEGESASDPYLDLGTSICCVVQFILLLMTLKVSFFA